MRTPHHLQMMIIIIVSLILHNRIMEDMQQSIILPHHNMKVNITLVVEVLSLLIMMEDMNTIYPLVMNVA
jgi:hypothetical protein